MFCKGQFSKLKENLPLNFLNIEQNKCDKQYRENLAFWGWGFKGVKSLYRGILALRAVDETLVSDHSNKS